MIMLKSGICKGANICLINASIYFKYDNKEAGSINVGKATIYQQQLLDKIRNNENYSRREKNKAREALTELEILEKTLYQS